MTAGFKILGLGLLLAGSPALVDMGLELRSGVVEVKRPGRSRRIERADRREDPDAFQRLMVYQGARCTILLAGGFMVLGVLRWADRSELM